MRILITGAAGFLGRHLVDLFSDGKNELVTIVRPTSDTAYLQEKNVHLIHGDLRDKACIEAAVKGADVVIHAAAALRGRWEDFQAINVDATRHLLEASVKHKVGRFVFISSVIVYNHSTAAGGTRFTEEMPFEEGSEQTYYCKTKIAAEELVRETHTNSKLATTILRPAAIYGKRGPLFLSRLGFAAGGNRYLIIGDGRLPLPLSHVEGVARAVQLCLEKEAAVGKTYNVVEDESVTQLEFFNQVRRYVKPRFSTLRLPDGFMKFMSRSADKILGLVGMTSPLPLSYMKLCAVPFSYSNDKLKAELGWKAQPDFRRSLRDMMLWHKQRTRSRRKLANDDLRVPIAATGKVRVGIAGCGVISRPHLKALTKLPNAEVVALCDPVEEARTALAASFSVPATYATFEEMLEKEKLDVVHVCTPAQSHGKISLAAMKKGCHVFVEKPFALNAAEARKMVNAARRHKVKLCAGHNHVFDKVMVDARKILASGALGQVTYVESWYGTSYSSDQKSRYLTYEARDNWAYHMPGSLYQNFISHPISLLLDVMREAEVQAVQAKFHRVVPHMPTDELRVTFENQKMGGLLNLSMAVSPRYFFLNIYGAAGTLRLDFLNKTVFLDKPSAKLPRVISRSLSAASHAKTLFGAAIRNIFAGVFGKYNMYQGNETLIRLFYKSILEDTAPPILPEEGLQSVEIMDAIWQRMSDRNGKSSAPPAMREAAVKSKNGGIERRAAASVKGKKTPVRKRKASA